MVYFILCMVRITAGSSNAGGMSERIFQCECSEVWSLFASGIMSAMIDRGWCLQVVKGLRGGVQDVALKMLIGETHYHINSFRQVQSKGP